MSDVRSLMDAAVALSSSLDLDAVLRRLVRIACRVVGARYGALGILDQQGVGLERFVYHGISAEQAERIGHLPKGLGILGAVIEDAHPLRLDDIAADPRSAGLPPGHPPMRSFLGVPVITRGRVFGNLYLTEKRGGGPFTAEDEASAVALARQAGVAVENARLHAEQAERLRAEAELAAARVRERMTADLLRQVIRAQEDERRRISRDLHDSAGQTLASILLGLKIAETEPTLPQIRARLADLRALTADAVAEMRRLALELRPTILDDLGLAAALERYASDFRQRTAVDVTLRVSLSERLEPEVEIVLYRVVQEALTNTAKYAGARSVRIELSGSRVRVRLRVTDDGMGFDPEDAAGRGLGLAGMRERARLVSGTLDIRSAPGRGTEILLEVPR